MSDQETAQISENEENNTETHPPDNKKRKKFHVKEFRQELNSNNALNAVKEFVRLCTHNFDFDYALLYLENGGSCSEFINLLDKTENKSASHNLPILEGITIVLLKIIERYPQKQINGEECCKELMNKHYNIIKNTLNLSANSIQRKVGLKLLTTMVTLSSKLAKDIISQVFFDESLIQILTTPSNVLDGSSVRTSFIHFIISFLIEGNIETIQLFLQKQFLLQSIFPGLLYDSVEIIQIFLNTVQINILENIKLSKTVKMNIFSQKLIQYIISLYEWRGPKNYNPKKKQMKISVDALEKSQICEYVHEFLLTLCTNKKFGIVFHDDLLGFGHTKHNILLSKVIKTLNKPWNNKYISDLVIKICISCPDIVKDVLQDVQSSFEIRDSQNWLNICHFVKQIIQQLDCTNIEKSIHKLNQKQIILMLQTFCVPQNLLNVISSDGILHENIGIRHENILLLSSMLNTLNNCLNIINNNTEISLNNNKYIKDTLTNYLSKNLPPISVLLQNIHKFDSNTESIIPYPTYNEHLTLILDVLYKYKLVCPEIMSEITKNINISNFFHEISSIQDGVIFLKATTLFIYVDASLFHPGNDLIGLVFPRLLHLFYTEENKMEIEKILVKIFDISGIFEGCEYEIYIWLYSILEFESWDEKFADFLVQILKDNCENFLEYNNELSVLKENQENYTTFNLKNWLNVEKNNFEVKMKHKNLSPFIIGLLKSGNCEYINKLLIHLLFSQTNPKILINLLLKNKNLLDKNLIKFCKNFENIHNIKNLLNNNPVYYEIFNYLTSEHVKIPSNVQYKNHSFILMTNFTIYYYTQSILHKKLNSDIQNKCLEILFSIINNCNDNNQTKNCLNSIFKHPLLLQLFSVVQQQQTNEGMCTEFVMKIIEHLLTLKTKDDLEIYLNSYRIKFVNDFCSFLKNYNENFDLNNIFNIIKIFDLNYEQCTEIISIISDIDYSKINNLSNILSYILNKNYKNNQIFNDKIIENLSKIIEKTSFENVENSFSNYIQKFPHLNKNFEKSFFENLLLKSNMNKSTIRLCTILLKYNTDFIHVFEKKLDKIIDKRELVFCLLNNVKNENNIFENIYKEYESIILKFVNKPQKVANYLIENYLLIIKFVQDFMKIEICNNIVSKIQKYDVTEIYHIEVLISIFNKSIVNEENFDKKCKIITNFICTFMHLLINILKRETLDWEKINTISKNINMFIIKIKNIYKINFCDENIYKNSLFLNFYKLSLKYGLQNCPSLIQTLKQICSFSKTQNSEFAQIFEMAISHSESLNILLSENEKKDIYLSLLLTLLQNNKTVMQKNHIPVFLGSYTATLSNSDQYILSILGLYEAADLGFHEYRPYLFSQAAVQYYSIKTGGFNSLWKQPKPKDVLDLFDEEKIRKTIECFPVTRKLRNGEGLYSDNDLEVYDPCFYLPLLSHLLAPESSIRWYHVTQRSVICLAIICLTSDCADMRAAAAHVISRFHSHLDVAQYAKQRLLWQHLTEFICRGTAALDNLKLSSIVGLFLCRTAMIFSKPDDVLYKPLGNYVMAKECPNFNIVPELLEMFFNTNVTYKIHRTFILKVLRDGIRTKDDLEVVFRSMTFKIIMDFYNSNLSNLETKKLILEIISSAVLIPHGSQILINNYSLLSWLQAILHDINDTDLLQPFICIINNLVISMPFSRLKYYKFKILLILISTINILNKSQIDLIHIVKFVKTLYLTYERRPDILNNDQLGILIKQCSKFVNCDSCRYYLEFGIKYIDIPDLKTEENSDLLKYYIELLTIKWIKANEQ